MKQMFDFTYSEKQIKKMNHHEIKGIFISVILSILLIILSSGTILILEDIYRNTHDIDLLHFLQDFKRPFLIGSDIISFLILIYIFIKTFLCANCSESYTHCYLSQHIEISDGIADILLSDGKHEIKDSFPIKKVKTTRQFIIIYKNCHNFTYLPRELFNGTKRDLLCK